MALDTWLPWIIAELVAAAYLLLGGVTLILGREPRLRLVPRELWVGYRRGDAHHCVCVLPCLALRWRRWPRPACS